ncbi:hypothetical protein C8J56DRAFT_773070, partial [Mycena floridula]
MSPRFDFEKGHPDDTTHIQRVLALRDRRVPVPIGPMLPRNDKADVAQKHARLMLILFKPWTVIGDLWKPDQTWVTAYTEFLQCCDFRIRKIMQNIQLLHDYKDANSDH